MAMVIELRASECCCCLGNAENDDMLLMILARTTGGSAAGPRERVWQAMPIPVARHPAAVAVVRCFPERIMVLV